MSCVKYLGQTRLHILRARSHFQLRPLQSIKLQDAVQRRECSETEDGANRLTSWRVARCYFAGSSVRICGSAEPRWRTWKITLMSANQKRTQHVLFGASFLSHIKARPGALFELRRWEAILLPTFQFDNTNAPGPSKFVDTVSASATIEDMPCDKWKCAYTLSSGSF